MAKGNPCKRCNGTGYIKGGFGGEDIPPTPCPNCRGTGQQQKPRCKDCLGYGIVNSPSGPKTCDHCKGTGDEP